MAQIGNSNAHKGKIVRSMIAKRLEERAALAPMVDALIEKAMDGDLQAIREIFDRVDGKPKQQVDLGGQEDNPLVSEVKIKLVRPDDNAGG